MRIPSGVTDQGFYFVAVDATDLKTRETGLSSFTVYRERNNGTATAMTTPTVTEADATNMPGVYFLLCDEDMTIGAGNDEEVMAFHITQASMAPVTREIELYRPKITAGETVDVTSGAVDAVTLVATTTTNTDMLTAATVNAQVDLALADIHLDHLMAAAAADVVVDGSVIAHIVSATEDWSTFVPSTDSLQALRAWIGDGTNLAEAGGTGDQLTGIAAVGDVTNLSNLPTIPSNWVTAAGIAADALTAIEDEIWDAPLTGAAHNDPTSAGRRLRTLQDFGVYEGGYVWLDTVNGTAGTTDYENGTVNLPTNLIASALTIRASVGLPGIHVLPASSFSFGATVSNFEFKGHAYTVDLDSRACDNTLIEGATVTGTYTGNPIFKNCLINGTITGPGATFIDCRFTGARLEINGTDGYLLHNPRGETPGSTASLIIDFNSTAGADCSLRNASLGIQIEGMVATNEMTCEGTGSLTEGTVTAGSPDIRGNWKMNSITNLTPVEEANINATNINTEADTALSDIKLDHLIAVADGDDPVDGSIIAHLASATEDWSTFVPSDDSLEAIRVRGDAAWTTGAGGDPWSTALPGAYGAGTAGGVLGAWKDGERLDLIQDIIAVDTTTDIPALIAALNNIAAADVLAAGDIDGYTLEEALKLSLAALTGVLAGAATTTITIEAADDSKTRLTTTVDSDGNRSAVVRDETG